MSYNLYGWLLLLTAQTLPLRTMANEGVRVMSYNLYGWSALVKHPWKAENIYKTIRGSGPELLGVQECERKQHEVAQHIGFNIIGDGSGGLAILYKPSAFRVLASGIEEIDERDQWGQRYIQWAQLVYTTDNTRVDAFNTHFPVLGDAELLKSAKRVGQVIQKYRSSGDSLVLLTGDFNVFQGFEKSQTIRYLKGQLGPIAVPLQDTFRVRNPDENGSTFGAAGKIDYVFSDIGRKVPHAWIDRNNYGEASDHFPVAAVVR